MEYLAAFLLNYNSMSEKSSVPARPKVYGVKIYLYLCKMLWNFMPVALLRRVLETNKKSLKLFSFGIVKMDRLIGLATITII